MMYSVRNWSTVVGDFRQSRKCFSFYGTLLLLVLLCIAQQATCRPSHDEDLPSSFNVGDDEFKNADNIEIHHVRVVDGVTYEDHPTIMYKEDFVSEDYVPPKNETKSNKTKRRYKDISYRSRHHKQNQTDIMLEEKPEKMLFDIIPETPLIVPEDLEKHRKSHLKLVPLSDDNSEAKESNEESISKSNLNNKRPKKYHHHRVRRDLGGEHAVQKRNPYYRHLPKTAGDVPAALVQYIYVKHSVPGKKHNGLDITVTKAPTNTNTITDPISFDNRVAADEEDRVIFSGGKTTPRPTTRPTESIFRDPRPTNFDFSFMSPQVTTTRPIFTRRPVTSGPIESIFRDPRPQNFDFGFMNQGQLQGQQTQQPNFVTNLDSASAATTPATQDVSQCVWAIVNCCSSRNSNVRYTCFENNGCYGAFWGINPCADNIRNNVVSFLADTFN